MTSERLNYTDALKVFLNVGQEFEEQARNEAKAKSKNIWQTQSRRDARRGE